MYYHAIAKISDEPVRYWWNRTRENLIEDVIIPYANKQVKKANKKGQTTLFNYGAITYLVIVKSDKKLKEGNYSRIPEEITSEEYVRKNNVTDEFLDDIRVFSATKETKSLIQKSLSELKKQVFVVMKFGDKTLDSAYEGVIKPIFEKENYKTLRVDEIENAGNINEQILNSISESELIYIDLSGERPNCYYEAGFAHAMGKNIIFSIHQGDNIHFDLAHHRFIEWETESELRKKLSKRFTNYLQLNNSASA